MLVVEWSYQRFSIVRGNGSPYMEDKELSNYNAMATVLP